MPYFQLTRTATAIIQLAALIDSKFELWYDYTNTNTTQVVAAITLLCFQWMRWWRRRPCKPLPAHQHIGAFVQL